MISVRMRLNVTPYYVRKKRTIIKMYDYNMLIDQYDVKKLAYVSWNVRTSPPLFPSLPPSQPPPLPISLRVIITINITYISTYTF